MASNENDRDDSGVNWSSQEVAERRNRGRARRGEIQGPATLMMLDLAEVRTGSRVLDVAAGTGDQTIGAAQRVGPSGYVLATDVSASMLKLAADAAREAVSQTSRHASWMPRTSIARQSPSMQRYANWDCFCSPIRRTCCDRCVEWFGRRVRLRQWCSRWRKEPLSRHHVGCRSPFGKQGPAAVLCRRNSCPRECLQREWLAQYHRPCGKR